MSAEGDRDPVVGAGWAMLLLRCPAWNINLAQPGEQSRMLPCDLWAYPCTPPAPAAVPCRRTHCHPPQQALQLDILSSDGHHRPTPLPGLLLVPVHRATCPSGPRLCLPLVLPSLLQALGLPGQEPQQSWSEKKRPHKGLDNAQAGHQADSLRLPPRAAGSREEGDIGAYPPLLFGYHASKQG